MKLKILSPSKKIIKNNCHYFYEYKFEDKEYFKKFDVYLNLIGCKIVRDDIRKLSEVFPKEEEQIKEENI